MLSCNDGFKGDVFIDTKLDCEIVSWRNMETNPIYN